MYNVNGARIRDGKNTLSKKNQRIILSVLVISYPQKFIINESEKQFPFS